jgi:16S rRNA G966 N2-methylase RsmD
MTGFSRYQRDALYYYGVKEVADLFTKRNLWALAALLEACRSSQLSSELTYVFQSNILSATTMQQYREGGGGFAKGTYYIPQVFIEREQQGCFSRKFSDVVAAQNEIQRDLQATAIFISTQSCTDLSGIPPSSLDYIFTDPPYADKVQYGELNFVWEAWLGFDTQWHDEEIIVNEVRGKSEADWANMMRQAMVECYRVLKPGRWLSLCYHDTSEGTWTLIQDIMAEAGFLVDQSDSALFIDAGQKSYNQQRADKVTKRDLVINFRKPKLGEVATAVTIRGDEDQATFSEKVRAIICDYLNASPGATKDRIYDEVVSRMVRAGRMEAHNFDELLSQVAEEVREPVKKNLFENESPNLFGTHEMGRWYLKETGASVLDAAESAKEDAAADKLKAFIPAYLKKHPAAEGVHYSDLFEQYVYAVKDKPRRPLVEWLLDYFYKTDAGTYRLPASPEEEQLKAAGRAQGTSRHIKRYLSYLQQGLAVPAKERPNDATLTEWIRHCKRSGLYEQGKLLYEMGGLNLDSLSEEMQVSVEEDYQICVRMLSRTQSDGKSVKKQK